MKASLTLVTLIIALVSSIQLLSAQEATVAVGGNISGSGGTVAFSTGQVVFLPLPGSSGTVLQGVQQPWEVFLVTGLESRKGVDIDCQVYPNPAGEFLKFMVNGWNGEKLIFQLFDATGRICRDGEVAGSENNIPVSGMVRGVYLFCVFTKTGQQVRTFKIIKN